jgi:hypothetical protein
VYSVQPDESSFYDTLTEYEFAGVMTYVNYHYDKARKNKTQSGTYTSPFEDFAQQKGWLVFYHDKLMELGNQDMFNVAYAELPSDAFMVSSGTKTTTQSGTNHCRSSPSDRRKAAHEVNTSW